MTSEGAAVEARANRLLRCYPPSWRERYGEEFGELLIADLSERPRSWRRTADVVSGGAVARLSVVGLGGGPVRRPQAALVTVGAAIVAFLGCGVSLWSQLLIGWRWSPPDSRAVTTGIVVMSIAVGYLAVLAMLAVVPIATAAIQTVRRGDARRLAAPLALIALGATVLILGGHHLATSWPGAGGRFQHPIPGRIAGYGWAETLGITTYWAHPHALLALPRAELGWLLVSPAALVATMAGSLQILRRVSLSRATLRYEAGLARAAAVGMTLWLVAAAWWVVSSHSGGSSIFRAGSLDLLLVATMAAAVIVARAATPAIQPRPVATTS